MSKSSKNKLPVPALDSLKLPYGGVESHAHLNSKQFAQDRDEVIERARTVGLARISQIFLSHAAWKEERAYFAAFPEFFFVLGIHPTDAELLDDAEFERIASAFEEDELLRAVGEIGLDYYWKDTEPALQKKVFIRQLNLAKDLDKPVVIHCREAESDTLNILKAEGMWGRPLLWHCFGGDKAMAELLLEAGWYISIPGPVTYPANKALRDALSIIPEDRLMMETDCPYLTPVPLRGKRNEPAYLAYTVQAMAEARGVDPASLWLSCGRTAAKFFGLPEIKLR